MEEDELDLQVSVTAYEHMARVFDVNGRLYTVHDGQRPLGIRMDPLERFRIELSELRVDEKELEILQEYASKLPFVMIRNPVAYLLGYRLAQGKQQNTRQKEKLNQEMKELATAYNSVAYVEVIRYARWWQNTLYSQNSIVDI